MFKISIVNRDKEFVFLPHMHSSLLEASESAGLRIANDCKRGDCSSCKCIVEKGSHSIKEGTNIANLPNPNFLLACISVPSSDMELFIEDINFETLPQKKAVISKINSIEYVSNDLCIVRLRLQPGSNFVFKAGQYIDITLNGITSSYSIASIPSATEVEIIIKRIPNGVFSDYWFNNAKEDDLLRFFGPKGVFFLRDDQSTKRFFIATGSGIGPIRSILNDPDNHSILSKSVNTLIWGNKSIENYIDFEFDLVDSKYSYVSSLNKQEGNHSPGRLISFFSDIEVLDENASFYLCGNSEMIHDVERVLINKGIRLNRIHSDPFLPSK